MSVAESNVVPLPTPKDDRDVWIKRLAELTDGEAWALADALAEHYPEDRFPASKGSTHNDLYAALREDELALARDYGIIATVDHLRSVLATARVWPAGDRSPAASFEVHRRIRGDNRKAELNKYLRMARREGRALSRRMLQRYRADERQDKPRQYDERLRRAIAGAVRREMLAGYGSTKRDDWWRIEDIVPSMTAEAGRQHRDIAVRELRALATQIENGAIDGKDR